MQTTARCPKSHVEDKNIMLCDIFLEYMSIYLLFFPQSEVYVIKYFFSNIMHVFHGLHFYQFTWLF